LREKAASVISNRVTNRAHIKWSLSPVAAYNRPWGLYGCKNSIYNRDNNMEEMRFR